MTTARVSRCCRLATSPSRSFLNTSFNNTPSSFAREAFFAVTAFRFTNAEGTSRHGRFHIRPEAVTEYLTNEEAARQPPNFLFDEIAPKYADRTSGFTRIVHLGQRRGDAAEIVQIELV